MANVHNRFKKCLDCPDRFPGCSGTCQYSIDVHAEMDRIKAIEQKEKDIVQYEHDMISKRFNNKVKHERSVHRRGRKLY